MGNLWSWLDERDRLKREAHEAWLATPEGQAQAAEWQAEESRYGDR